MQIWKKMLIAVGITFLYGGVFADLDRFEITAPSTAYINEAIDITIAAMDENNQVMTDYRGTIYFDIVGDDEAIVPSILDGYTFTEIDEGEHTFSKGITFKNTGTIEIDVLDIDDDLGSITTHSIEVKERGGSNPGTTEVTIISPVDGTTLTGNSVLLKGVSQENSALNILLNGNPIATSQTDETGEFQIQVEGLGSGENTLAVEVLDGDENIIGVSDDVYISVDSELPAFTNLEILEGDEILAGTPITLKAIAEAGLEEVVASIGDTNIVLEETEELGVYMGNSIASEFIGEYTVDILLKNALGIEFEGNTVASFKTIPGTIKNVKIETSTSRVKFTWQVDPDVDKIQYFKIKYGVDEDNLTTEVVTFQKDEIATGSSYAWYVPGIEPGEYSAKIVALDEDEEELLIESDIIDFVIALQSASACFIDQVGGVHVETFEYESVIHWDALEDAETYKIYVKTIEGDWIMVDEVTENHYVVPIDMNAPEEIWEEFSIKATCKDGDIVGESDEFSRAVLVQTGPEIALVILMVLLSSSAIMFTLMRKGYIK